MSSIWLDSSGSFDTGYVKWVPSRDSSSPAQDLVDVIRVVKTTLEGILNTSFEVGEVGEVSARDLGAIPGQLRLTKDDVITGRQHEDPLAQCYWPIEYWHPEHGVQMQWPEDDACYEVCEGHFRGTKHGNLWAMSKAISSDSLARSSFRVVGHLWAAGFALGHRLSTKGGKS